MQKNTESNQSNQTQAQKTENTQNVNTQKHNVLEVNFSTFILSLASSALMHLGEVPNPDSQEEGENRELAKHTIDILNMLEDKLKHGLTKEEESLFADVLYEVRMKFVKKNERG